MLEYAVFAFLAAGSWLDASTRKIPNWLNGLFFALGFALVVSGGLLSASFALSLALSLAFAYLLYRLKAWGGGDAKFFAALAAWHPLYGFPPDFFVWLFLASALLLAPAFLACKTKRPPFAPFISAAFVVLLALKHFYSGVL